MIIKDSNLRRTLFENRYKILGIIVAIILVLCLIRVLNEMAKQKLKTQVVTNTTQSTYKPQETVILGDNVSTSAQEKNSEVMDNFIKYCNEKEVGKAYNLLTQECQEEIFSSSIENFKKNYIEKIFSSTKIYSMQSWINGTNPTYKVRILDDMLATGKTGNVVEDYYTIVKQNGDYKLNINSYIGRKQINKEKTVGNMTITILSKDTYMNYETYNIKVQNNTENTIILDSKENEKSVYITGDNEITYRAFMYEIDDVYLTIKPRIYTKLTVKFNKIYSPNIQTESITFSDIINNADTYRNLQNKKDYKDRTKIEIEL